MAQTDFDKNILLAYSYSLS